MPVRLPILLLAAALVAADGPASFAATQPATRPSAAGAVVTRWNLPTPGTANVCYRSLGGGRRRTLTLRVESGAGVVRIEQYADEGAGPVTTRVVPFDGPGGEPLVVRGVLRRVTVQARTATRGTFDVAPDPPPTTRPE